MKKLSIKKLIWGGVSVMKSDPKDSFEDRLKRARKAYNASKKIGDLGVLKGLPAVKVVVHYREAMWAAANIDAEHGNNIHEYSDGMTIINRYLCRLEVAELATKNKDKCEVKV